jgi:hypothetical protein
MAVEQAQQWLPDPAGKHQFRLHTDGKPTEWVSDDGSMTVDRLDAPTPAPAPASDGVAATVASIQGGSTAWGSASNSQPPVTAVTPPVRPAGWYRNASNPSEVRYWDGTQWAMDQTVATDTPSAAPAAPAAPAASTPAPAADVLPGPGSPTSIGPVPRQPEALTDDAPGRHSLGRTQPTEAARPADYPTSNSVWAHPEAGVEQPPAVSPAVASIVAPSVASVVPPEPAPAAAMAAPPKAPEVSPPAEAPLPEPAAATPSVPLSTIPADWYPDPSNRTRLRYWDGAGWTEHVLDEAPAHRPPAVGPPQ